MTQYDASMPNVHIAFKPQSLTNTLGEYLALQGKTQLRIAETEKYAPVTFFFNGGVEKVSEGEERVLVNSPKVATYDLKPEMSAFEVATKACENIESGKFNRVLFMATGALMSTVSVQQGESIPAVAHLVCIESGR